VHRENIVFLIGPLKARSPALHALAGCREEDSGGRININGFCCSQQQHSSITVTVDIYKHWNVTAVQALYQGATFCLWAGGCEW
jgi:hypothetical protein